MTGQQALNESTRQVRLQLTQDDHHASALLAGNIVPQDCLLLSTQAAFAEGKPADLFVQFLTQCFHVGGTVQSCMPEEHGYQVCFCLAHDDHLQTRMLLQLSRVEQYRHDMAEQGRHLSIDEAAREWVSLFAEKFAEEFDT